MGILARIATSLIPGVGWTKWIMPGAALIAVAGVGIQEIRVSHAHTTIATMKADAATAQAKAWADFVKNAELVATTANAAAATERDNEAQRARALEDQKALITGLEKKYGTHAVSALTDDYLGRLRDAQRGAAGR